MTAAVYGTVVTIFCLVFSYSRLFKTAVKILYEFEFTVQTAFNRHLDDHSREKIYQQSALVVLRLFIVLLFKTALTAATVILTVIAAERSGLVTVQQVIDFSMRPEVLAGTTAALVLLVTVWRRLNRQTPDSDKSADDRADYSTADRLIHNLAFGSDILQKSAMALSKRYRNRWQNYKASRPIFITALPRAGTTILLEALFRIKPAASHTYRDMPFIFTPVLWNRLTSHFRKKSRMKERAHKDGLQVNENSPEALEEALWVRFFRHKYTPAGIAMWKDADPKFGRYLHEHMKKIIHLRSPGYEKTGRYISKNNANIARLPALRTMFDDAWFVICLRDPFEHAASMLRQHLNFLDRQRGDFFVKKYMQDIGHFEFGQLHRPVLFHGLEKYTAGLNPQQADYWLGYWLAAYSWLDSFEDDRKLFLSYGNLCDDSRRSLTVLCSRIGLEVNERELDEAAALIRPSPARKIDTVFDRQLSRQAGDLYDKIYRQCINQ